MTTYWALDLIISPHLIFSKLVANQYPECNHGYPKGVFSNPHASKTIQQISNQEQDNSIRSLAVIHAPCGHNVPMLFGSQLLLVDWIFFVSFGCNSHYMHYTHGRISEPVYSVWYVLVEMNPFRTMVMRKAASWIASWKWHWLWWKQMHMSWKGQWSK